MFHLLAITAGSDGSRNFFGDASEVAIGLELHMTLKEKKCEIKISWAEAVSLLCNTAHNSPIYNE